jgi:hypothetical protein
MTYLGASRRGAQKLLFTSTNRGADQYSAMRDKVINLLECQPHQFRKPAAVEPPKSHR